MLWIYVFTLCFRGLKCVFVKYVDEIFICICALYRSFRAGGFYTEWLEILVNKIIDISIIISNNLFNCLYFNLALILAKKMNLWCFKMMFNIKLKREVMHMNKSFFIFCSNWIYFLRLKKYHLIEWIIPNMFDKFL